MAFCTPKILCNWCLGELRTLVIQDISVTTRQGELLAEWMNQTRDCVLLEWDVLVWAL